MPGHIIYSTAAGGPVGRPCRVVHLEPEADVVFLAKCGLFEPPEAMALSSVLAAVDTGLVKVTSQAEVAARRPIVKTIYRERAKAGLERLGDLARPELRPLLMDPRTRAEMIRTRASELGIESHQVSRVLYKFFEGGMCLEALYPRYRGVPKGTRQSSGRKRGRPSRDRQADPSLQELAIDDALRKKVLKVIDKRIATCKSFSDLTKAIDAEVFADGFEVVDGTLVPKLLPKHRRLSHAQVKWLIKQADAQLELTRRKVGSRVWNAKYRQLLGSSKAFIRGPGALYELDATYTQVYMVREGQREKVLRPAVIYLVVDVYSNMIVGVHVTLENPKWNAVRLAIFNAVQGKVEFCAYYGIAITREQWAAEGMPMRWQGDRGSEVLSGSSEDAIESGMSAWSSTAPYRGDLKPNVENRIGVMKKMLLRKLFGAKPKYGRERARKDPRESACLTLFELTRLVIDFILEYNRHPIPLRAVPPDARRAFKVRPTPNDLWSWGLKQNMGCLRAVDHEVLYRSLLPKDRAWVRRDGIHFGGGRYTCPEAERDQVFARAGLKGKGIEIDVWFDAACSEYIWIFDQRHDRYLRCTRIDPQRQYARYRFEDLEDEAQDYSVQALAARDEARELDVQAYVRRNATQNQAMEQRQAALTGRSRAFKTESARQNHFAERELAAEELRRMALAGYQMPTGDQQRATPPLDAPRASDPFLDAVEEAWRK